MKISVALCTYNGEKYLSEQLNSILNQTYSVDEIIICDDRSTDNTIRIIQNFQVQYSHLIQLVVNELNLGGKKNFEKALSFCTGDIIFFCDQDDVWSKNKVGVMVAALISNPECLGVASDAVLMNDDIDIPDSSFWKSMDFELNNSQFMVDSDFSFNVLLYGNVVAGSMLAIKKEAVSLIYPFKFLEDMWHDEWIVLKLSEINKLLLLNSKLVHYRMHEGQQIGVGSNNQESWLAYKKLLKDTGKLKQNPLKYLTHTAIAYNRLKRYTDDIQGLKVYEVFLKNRLQDAKINFLKSHIFFLRKAKLIKWFINKEFETTLLEVFTL